MVLLQRSAANSLDVNNGYADWRFRSTLVDHQNRAVIGMIPEKSEFHFVRRTTSLRYLDRIDSDIINATVTYNNYVQTMCRIDIQNKSLAEGGIPDEDGISDEDFQ
jgi:hypothetical protein